MISKSFIIISVSLFSSMSFGGCMPFNQAALHIGEKACIKGEVFHVEEPRPGVANLVFCNDRNHCAFTAWVAVEENKGADLHELEGKTISIHGLLKDENGDAQMTLPNSRQLMSQDSEMPSFMKAFDVEERGHGSVGTSRAPKPKRTSAKKQTTTLPVSILEDSEEF